MTVTIPKRRKVANHLAQILVNRTMSTHDLLQITGFPEGTLATGLRMLRQAGLLRVTKISPTGLNGRPLTHYTLGARVIRTGEA